MTSINRRNFVKQASASATGLIAAGQLIGNGFARESPNNTVNVAVMGIRSRGSALSEGFAKLPDVNVSVLCDIDENLLPKAVADVEKACGKRPKTETDIRRALDNKDIDAVVIAAPNNWHALATIWACQAGKDVYVEKPASYDISEGRRMIEAARKYDRMVQVGTQNRSRPLIQAAVDYLHAGKLGKIHMIKCLVFRPRESIGHKANGPVPKGVNYDLWRGPAQMRPFNENRFHYNWHWFWDTGNGETGNNGPHYADIARWILKKYEHPVRIQSMGYQDIHDSDQETPTSQFSIMEYSDHTRVQIEVRNGYTNAEDGMRMGLLVYGSEGWMRLGTDDWATYFGRKEEPGAKMTEDEANAKVDTLNPRGTGDEPHLANFVDAVRSRKRQSLKAEILEGHLSTSLCHLANIAYRANRQVVFDSRSETFPGDAEANKYLSRAYRSPFVVPAKV
ncbi:MAG: Inositol 2-dehydrogenase/D-chiro-inositol 3-dehydrogenase [Acidobacteria bacterium]|nr:Inositol 2-dehydrogenase/D-chiro-inositol 3-dehydrogenase [Acidobacteriota bacterium]